ncbi:MAG: LptF/LptG family permease [Rubricella sp.]
MSRLDRYVLVQLAGPMGFFTLVSVGLVWLTQSMRVVDIIVANNQSGMVFLELSGLLLPSVVAATLPIAALAATLFTLNRLWSESELVVMLATGRSELSLLRPIAFFGGITLVAAFVLGTTLAPMATSQLRERTAELRAELTNSILQSGRFVSPIRGVTVFVRDATRSGEMADIFVHDTRTEGVTLTHTAERARLIRIGDEAQIVMVRGATQRLDLETGNLSLLEFDRFAYDLGLVVRSTEGRRVRANELSAFTLIDPPDALWEGDPVRRGTLVAEGHDQISGPLYALAMPLVAAAVMLGGGFRRRGLGPRIAFAIGCAVGLRVLGVSAKSAAVADIALVPLLYALPLGGIAMALAILWSRLRPGRRRRSATAMEASA